MKKLLIFLIVASMAVTMVACSANAETPSDSPSSLPEISSSESVSEEEAPAEFDIPEENQKLGDIITAARTDEFNESYQLLLSKDDPNAQMLGEFVGINYDDMDAFALSVSMMSTQAYAVAVLKPTDGKGEAVLSSVNTFIENQKKAFEQYLPDQKEIADAATVNTLDDGTIVLVMSEGGADVEKSILEALKK